jgi:UDP-galactopyranose mutase
MDHYDIIIVGAGLSGAVIAQQYASHGNSVLIVEHRSHIGGNCYDYIDNETGIRCNLYGPHYFHTNDEEVWEYVNRFGEWERYENHVVANIDGKTVSIPVNISTINSLCGEHIQTTEELDEWLSKNQVKYEHITDGEQMAKSRVGSVLYDKIFKHYTYKQWDKYPNELSPEVLARIPLRRNHDTRYFNDKYQALPKNGYTAFFEQLLNHPNIEIMLNTDFFQIKTECKRIPIVYTGPIDRYFTDRGYEKLEYRSLDIVFERHLNMNYYQQRGQVNYPGNDVKFTRITEYKHLLNQQSPHTIISKEYSCADGEPYYPVLNNRNLELYEQYRKLAEKEPNVYFVGRLANFKYYNMDEAIKNALQMTRCAMFNIQTNS